MLAAAGFLRLGTFIKFIPFPVTVGFTAGIAVIIFASQIRELFGLTLEHEPGELWRSSRPCGMRERASRRPRIGLSVLPRSGSSSGCARWRPHWPGMLVSGRAGGCGQCASGAVRRVHRHEVRRHSSLLPAPHLPDCPVDKIIAVLPAAISFTLLGASSRCSRRSSLTA